MPSRSALLVLSAMGGEPSPANPPWIHCTPDSVEVAGERASFSSNSIAEALERAAPGSVVYLDPGDYPGFSIGLGQDSPSNAATSGGLPGQPIVVEGTGEVRIIGKGDAIAIDQRTPNGNITFRNLTIVPGERAGVMFYKQGSGRVHAGFAFEDCHILGRFDPVAKTGVRSKWGIWGHSLAGFRFAGVRAPARVQRIALEHAFYLQNHRGSIMIENVRARDLGRTFFQLTARAGEGAAGSGDVTIRRCEVEDIGLAAGDGFKGGSAFTFAGRLKGVIRVEDCSYRAGFRSELRSLTLPGVPYGTGALVAWQGGESSGNDTLILHDNRFRFAAGCGDRPVVSIGGCRNVVISGQNEFVSGGKEPALALDPVDDQGRPSSPANGKVFLAPQTTLKGSLTLAGSEATPQQRSKLQGGG